MAEGLAPGGDDLCSSGGKRDGVGYSKLDFFIGTAAIREMEAALILQLRVINSNLNCSMQVPSGGCVGSARNCVNISKARVPSQPLGIPYGRPQQLISFPRAKERCENVAFLEPIHMYDRRSDSPDRREEECLFSIDHRSS